MKRLFLLLVIFSGLLSTCYAQVAEQVLKMADESEKALNDQLAYQQYLRALELEPNNHTALYKASLLADRLGNRVSAEKARRDAYYKKAHQFASKALQLYPNSGDAHFAMAVSLGRVALMSSGKELVDAVKKIKYHADKAIQIDPNDFRPYHVLGRWYYEISDLGSFKRGAVKLFYGAFPDASFDLAAKAYEKSMALNPSFILNYLELARACQQLDQRAKAIQLLKKMQTLPAKMEDDVKVKAEGKKLLHKLTA
jgi:tetratricopeptide (TPR) repeat protein